MRVPPGSRLVFDQVLTGQPTGLPSPSPQFEALATNDSKFNDWLGKPNDLALFVVIDRVDSFIDVLQVTVEDTADEEAAWASSTVIYSHSVSVTTVVVAADTDASRGRPGLGFRRIAIAAIQSEGTGISARVRVWATGRNGYRRFNRLLLAERLEGTGAMFAPYEACVWLASVDRVAVGIQTDEIPAGTSPTLNFLLSESPNGRVWNEGSSGPNPIIPGGLLALTAVSDFAPLSGFLRFGVQLGGTNPAATVRMWVTGRDVRSG